ncbi:MAG: hypothetical protein A2231_12450, partial [Candidatus Firestonebacteria bacterium RIFOXYA2_FULL_40_8]
MKYIRLLNTLTKKDVLLAGSKAVLLSEVQRAGIKTTPGFVLTVSAFNEFFRKNKIIPFIRAGNLPLVREAVLKGVIPQKIKSEVMEAFKKLGASKVAVRSSSPFEDTLRGAAAGQFETFLNIPEEEVFESIKKVWTSLFAERAVSYAKQNKGDSTKLSMAVLVQAMVESDVSGVAFSINPATLDDKFVVIEGCKGLCDKLVDGKISPERFTVQKNNLAVMENGFMLSTEKLEHALISDADLKRISSHVICLENYLGFHVDTEWALCRGELFFLQCRPVTAIEHMKKNTDVWSNVNIAEVLPGQNYPLVVSFCSTTIGAAGKKASGMHENLEIMRGIKGRLYFNISAIEDHLRNNLGMTKFSVSLLFGGEKSEIPGPSRIKLKSMLKLLKFGLGLFISSLFLQSWLKKFTAEAKVQAKDWEEQADKAVTLEEMVSLKKRIILVIRENITKSFNALILPLFWIDIYNKAAKKYLPDIMDKHLLLSGDFEGVEILSGFKALWTVSRLLQEKRELAGEFLKTSNTSEAETVINKDVEIKAAYDKFIELYGYRCVKEIDFSQPRWQEDRSFIINNLRTYVQARDNLSPDRKEEDLLAKRQELLQSLKKDTPSWKLSILTFLAKKARTGQNTRELVKSSLIRSFVPIRKVILKTAKLLLEKKLIKEEVDIFFLLDSEFDGLLYDIKPLKHIPARKLEYLKNRDIYLPDVITDLDLLVGKGQYEPSPDIKELKGLAVSRGKVIGIARVIMRAEDIGRLLPDDILVTDHTDPGWTPAFVAISALVTNTGGLLSHASIVAREY